MAWKIDRDYIDADSQNSAVGMHEGSIDGETIRFRLRDDDGEIYYAGVVDREGCLQDGEPGGLQKAWEWAMADAGATDLQLHGADAMAMGLTSQRFIDDHAQTPQSWISIYA